MYARVLTADAFYDSLSSIHYGYDQPLDWGDGDWTDTSIQLPGMSHILGFYDQFLPRDAHNAKRGIEDLQRR